MLTEGDNNDEEEEKEEEDEEEEEVAVASMAAGKDESAVVGDLIGAFIAAHLRYKSTAERSSSSSSSFSVGDGG